VVPDFKFGKPVMSQFGCRACALYALKECLIFWYFAGFNVFGELKGHSSHLTPSSVIDSVVNEFVSANLGVASTILLADVLTIAERQVLIRFFPLPILAPNTSKAPSFLSTISGPELKIMLGGP
jgi:hypothetical protein